MMIKSDDYPLSIKTLYHEGYVESDNGDDKKVMIIHIPSKFRIIMRVSDDDDDHLPSKVRLIMKIL